jgi:hypothetical protein
MSGGKQWYLEISGLQENDMSTDRENGKMVIGNHQQVQVEQAEGHHIANGISQAGRKSCPYHPLPAMYPVPVFSARSVCLILYPVPVYAQFTQVRSFRPGRARGLCRADENLSYCT